MSVFDKRTIETTQPKQDRENRLKSEPRLRDLWTIMKYLTFMSSLSHKERRERTELEKGFKEIMDDICLNLAEDIFNRFEKLSESQIG